jgi:hypothetical protein
LRAILVCTDVGARPPPGAQLSLRLQFPELSTGAAQPHPPTRRFHNPRSDELFLHILRSVGPDLLGQVPA